MHHLLKILKVMDSLARAPNTERGQFGPSGSPYKPLLLLTALTRIHQRHPRFRTPEIQFADVNSGFLRLFEAFYPESPLEIDEQTAVQPFWKLGAGTPLFWELVPHTGTEDALKVEIAKPAGNQVKTKQKLNFLVSCARLSEDQWCLANEPLACETMITFLLARYFSEIDSADGLRAKVWRSL